MLCSVLIVSSVFQNCSLCSAVISLLLEKSCLLRAEKFSHQYPCDWRTKQPLVIRLSHQWFMDLDKIRQRALVIKRFLSHLKCVPHYWLHSLEHCFVRSSTRRMFACTHPLSALSCVSRSPPARTGASRGRESGASRFLCSTRPQQMARPKYCLMSMLQYAVN